MEFASRLLTLIVGLMLIAYGAYMLLVILAFASMIDPSFEGRDWWAEYLGKLYNQALGQLILFLAMIGVGLVLCCIVAFRRPRVATKPEPSRSLEDF